MSAIDLPVYLTCFADVVQVLRSRVDLFWIMLFYHKNNACACDYILDCWVDLETEFLVLATYSVLRVYPFIHVLVFVH